MEVIKKLLVHIFLVIMVLCQVTQHIYATDKTEGDQRLIKVGLPMLERLIEKDESSEYIGYNVDYLTEIQKYNNWVYEYVVVEGDLKQQISTLQTMLDNCEIDMIGTMFYDQNLEKKYDYPEYDYGHVYTSLAVNSDETRFIKGEYVNWPKIKVGYEKGNNKYLIELEQMASINHFDYEIVAYENHTELVNALKNKEIDAMLEIDIELPKEFKIISKFAPKPLFFISNKGNSEIIRELNNALMKIEEHNSSFKSKLEQKYFSYQSEFIYTDSMKEYISGLKPLKVVSFAGNGPMGFISHQKNYGVNVDYFDEMAQTLGIDYKLTMVSTQAEFEQLFQAGQIDLILGIPYSLGFKSKLDYLSMTMTLPYYSSYLVKVVGEVDAQNEQIELLNVLNSMLFLNNIKNHEISGAYLDINIVNYNTVDERFSDLEVVFDHEEEVFYCMAIFNDEYRELINIIDNYIEGYEDGKVKQLVHKYLYVHQDLTLKNFMYKYRYSLTGSLMLIILCGFVIYYRNKANLNRSKLIENERLIEFNKLVSTAIFEYDFNKDYFKFHSHMEDFKDIDVIENFSRSNRLKWIQEALAFKKDMSKTVELSDGWYRLTIKMLKDNRGKSFYAIGSFVNINEEYLEKQELIKQGQCDPLTQLLNRNTIETEINNYIATHHRGLFCLIDLDNFKKVNDQLGHPEGDQLLVDFAAYLKKYFCKGQLLGRLGGDEFVVFLPCYNCQRPANEYIEKFMNGVKIAVFDKYKEQNVAMSLGAVYVSKDNTQFKDLYLQADKALYLSKSKGKNTYIIKDKE